MQRDDYGQSSYGNEWDDQRSRSGYSQFGQSGQQRGDFDRSAPRHGGHGSRFGQPGAVNEGRFGSFTGQSSGMGQAGYGGSSSGYDQTRGRFEGGSDAYARAGQGEWQRNRDDDHRHAHDPHYSQWRRNRLTPPSASRFARALSMSWSALPIVINRSISSESKRLSIIKKPSRLNCLIESR